MEEGDIAGKHEMVGPGTGNRVEPVSNGSGEKKNDNFRAEIDTSAPFESVKEAVSRFGGIGYWKPTLSAPQHESEEFDAEKLEEQAELLEKELILKERETLDVLKELETTRGIVEDLRSKLQMEECEVNLALKKCASDTNSTMQAKEEDKENQGIQVGSLQNSALILTELNQAKLNLTRTTNDLADVRASIESLNKKLEKERVSLEKTRERFTQNSSKISSIEEELNPKRLRFQVEKDAGIECGLDNPSDVTRELQRLSSEAENFKKMGEAARSEVLRKMSEIEQTKTMIRTAEIRLVAARKMKEAARAAEAAALAEIKFLSHHKSSTGDSTRNEVILSFEEYTALTNKARNAEEQSKKRVLDSILQVDEANLSKMDILKRVEEATEEVKTSKTILEEVLQRVEAANRGKLAVEETLRKWRSEGLHPSALNSTKLKNFYPSQNGRDSVLLDVNGLNRVNDEANPVLKPTLSIGQILSRKLLQRDELEAGMLGGRTSMKRKVSLAQMLSKQKDDPDLRRKIEKENNQKHFSANRKKFGFKRFSVLLAKQQSKMKKPLDLR